MQSLRVADAAHQVLKARVRAEIVDPQVSFEVPRDIQGSLLISFFQELERSVLVAKSSVYCRDHIRRNIATLRFSLEVMKDLLRFGFSADRCKRMRERSGGIVIAIRYLNCLLILRNRFQ